MDNEISKKAIENGFFIKSGYQSRKSPSYFIDSKEEEIWQPQVYELANYLGEHFCCKYVIDIGCGNAFKLTKLYPDFQIIGIDYGINILSCIKEYSFGTWIEHDLESPQKLRFSEDILKDSIIICADVIEHLINPVFLLMNIKEMLEISKICLISTPERDLERGTEDFGPPQNSAHVREWNINELTQLLQSFGLNVKFTGLTVSDNVSKKRNTSLIILGNNNKSDYLTNQLDSPDIKGNILKII